MRSVDILELLIIFPCSGRFPLTRFWQNGDDERVLVQKNTTAVLFVPTMHAEWRVCSSCAYRFSRVYMRLGELTN